jgi:hypothetical protein
MSQIQDKLIEAFKLDGSNSVAEYLAGYTDDVVVQCSSEEQKALVEELSKVLYEKFNMDTAKYPIVSRLEQTLLLNMPEDKVLELLNLITSPEYKALYDCLSVVLDEFSDGLDDIDSVIGIEPVAGEREVKILM